MVAQPTSSQKCAVLRRELGCKASVTQHLKEWCTSGNWPQPCLSLPSMPLEMSTRLLPAGLPPPSTTSYQVELGRNWNSQVLGYKFVKLLSTSKELGKEVRPYIACKESDTGEVKVRPHPARGLLWECPAKRRTGGEAQSQTVQRNWFSKCYQLSSPHPLPRLLRSAPTVSKNEK